jgi:thiamine-phosphate pyrophosphorylase
VHYTSDFRKSIKPAALYDHRHEWHEKNKSLSSSFHTGDTFASSELFDYVFYSPIANSISKSEREMVDPLQLIIDLSFIKTDVIALGGICPDVMQSMELSFFEGVAALGWIWNKGGEPLVQFNALKELCPVSASL